MSENNTNRLSRDWSNHLLESQKDIEGDIALVSRSFGTSTRPFMGPSYILPSGEFLKIRNANINISNSGSGDRGLIIHLDVQKWLNKQHNKEVKYVDDIDLEEVCIRVNTDMMEHYIVLPKQRPNDNQFEALKEWIDFFYDKTDTNLRLVSYYGPTTTYFKGAVAEDIIDDIKAYYTRGMYFEKVRTKRKPIATLCEGYTPKEGDFPFTLEDIENKYPDLISNKYESCGSAFIMPDGRFILSGNRFDTHDDFAWQCLMDIANMSEQQIEDEYDTNNLVGAFTIYFDLVRVNDGSNKWVEDRAYFVIPKNRISSSQQNGLLDYLDYVLKNKFAQKTYTIQAYVGTNLAHHSWDISKDITSDEILDDVKGALIRGYFTESLKEDMSESDQEVLNVLDETFGQGDNIVDWSTYILPNGHCLSFFSDKINDKYLSDPAEEWFTEEEGEHARCWEFMTAMWPDMFETSYNCEDFMDKYCIKVNVNFPYVSLALNEVSPQQWDSLKEIMKCLLENPRDYYWMECPENEKGLVSILTKRRDTWLNLFELGLDEFMKEVQEGYIRGFFENLNEDTEEDDSLDDGEFDQDDVVKVDGMYIVKTNKLDLSDVESYLSEYLTTECDGMNGPVYIFPDGLFIDIMNDYGDRYSIHYDIALDLINNFYNVDSEIAENSLGDVLDYLEENLGLIRCNGGEGGSEDRTYVSISKVPTEDQYKALEKYFYNLWQAIGKRFVTIMIETGRFKVATFEFDKTQPEDIVKAIRRSFVSGQLLSEKNYKTPTKTYDFDGDKVTWDKDAEDYIYWGSEADKWAEDYAKSYKVQMSPKDFLDLTTQGGANSLKKGDNLGFSQLRDLDKDEFNKWIHQPIFLQIAFRDKNHPQRAQVTGHEGRHRMFALMQAGYKSVDVELSCEVWDTSYDKYHPFKLDSIELIGQFNPNVRVEVYNPIPLSWKQHKSIRPELKDEKLEEKIVKVGNKYQVQSEKGRNLGTYDTKKEAEDRLKQVHYFKHMNESSKYDSNDKLLKECGEFVYHATYKSELDKIYKEGLHDFWFGIDDYECLDMIEYNHDKYDEEVIIAIPTKYLDANKCDFTVDSGDGYSDVWAGTGVYNGTITKDQFEYIYDVDNEDYIKESFKHVNEDYFPRENKRDDKNGYHILNDRGEIVKTFQSDWQRSDYWYSLSSKEISDLRWNTRGTPVKIKKRTPHTYLYRGTSEKTLSKKFGNYAGLFFGVARKNVTGWGEVKKYSLKPEAKIYSSPSSGDFVKKYINNDYKEIKDYFGMYFEGVKDISKLKDFENLTKKQEDKLEDNVERIAGNQFCWYDVWTWCQQLVAKIELEKQGYDGAHWTEFEDFGNPEQYQIWNLDVLKSYDGEVESLQEDIQETDNEGNILSKEQIEFFKNSKVRDRKGRLIVCYHGTNKDFNTFDKSLLGTGEGTVWGKGFYFFKGKDSEANASEYGSTVKKVYINITNPIKEEPEMFAKLLKFNYPEADAEEFEKFRERYWDDYNDEYILPLYVQRKLKVKVDDLEDLFLKMVTNAGYDGRIVDNEVICYESNQIKSIDNKNPTSSSNINENPNLTKHCNSTNCKSLNESKEDLLDTLYSSKEPEYGSCYLLDDGTFLFSSPKDSKSSLDFHGDEDDIIDDKFGTHKGYDLKHELSHDYNAIVLNSRKPECRMNFTMVNNKPTESQYDALLKWLDFVQEEGNDRVEFEDYRKDAGKIWDYYLSKSLPEEIIDSIKRYFATGLLVDSLQEKLDEFDSIVKTELDTLNKWLDKYGFEVELVNDKETLDEIDWSSQYGDDAVGMFLGDIQDNASVFPIALNKKVIQELCKDKDDLIRGIKGTLWHEAGHGIYRFLEDTMDISEDEEDCVEEFARYRENSTLFDILQDYMRQDESLKEFYDEVPTAWSEAYVTDDLHKAIDRFNNWDYRCCYDTKNNVIGMCELGLDIHDHIDDVMKDNGYSNEFLYRFLVFHKNNFRENDIDDEIDYYDFELEQFEYENFYLVWIVENDTSFESTKLYALLGKPINKLEYVKENLNESKQDKQVVYKFDRELKPNEVVLYHQTSEDNLKKIFKDGFIKGDVWAQEDIDTWNYGRYAIGFAIDRDRVHKANETDRIVYVDVPKEDFVCILDSMGRTPIGIEKFKDEFELNESKQDIEKFRQWAGDDLANRFFKLKDRLPDRTKDIYYWMSMEKQLLNLKNRYKDAQERSDISNYEQWAHEQAINGLKLALDNVEQTPTRREVDKLGKEGSEKIYEDDNWLVLKINTYEASVKYGKGTEWCITGNNSDQGRDDFNHHTQDFGATMYFFINKKNNNSKYALEYVDDENWCLFDETDFPHVGYGTPFNNGMDAMGGECWHKGDLRDTFPVIKGLPDINKAYDDFEKYDEESLNEEVNKYYRLEIEDRYGDRAGLWTGAFELIPTKSTIEEYPEDFKDLTPDERRNYYQFDYLLNQLSKIKSPGVDTNFNGFRENDIFAFTSNKYAEIKDIIDEMKQVLKELGFKLLISELDIDDVNISYRDDDQVAFSKSNSSKYINESKEDWEKFKQWCGDDSLYNRFVNSQKRLDGKYKDIYYWMGLEKKYGKHGAIQELQAELRNIESTPTRKEKDELAKEGAILLYNQNGWKVYKIETKEASQKYGKGSMWCISGEGGYDINDGFWNGHEDCTYFFIHGNEKYALIWHKGDKVWDIWNELDEIVPYIPNAPKVDGLPDVSKLPDFITKNVAKLYNISVDDIKDVKSASNDPELMDLFLDYDSKENYVIELKDGTTKYCYVEEFSDFVDVTEEIEELIDEYFN